MNVADLTLDPAGTWLVRVFDRGEFVGVCLEVAGVWRFSLFDDPAYPSGPRTLAGVGDSAGDAVAAYLTSGAEVVP